MELGIQTNLIPLVYKYLYSAKLSFNLSHLLTLLIRHVSTSISKI